MAMVSVPTVTPTFLAREDIDFVVKTDGIDDMHVIDGDILEGVPDKKIPFNIQCMIKKINKDFVQLIIIIHKK